jgi:hypothetical protein
MSRHTRKLHEGFRYVQAMKSTTGIGVAETATNSIHVKIEVTAMLRHLRYRGDHGTSQQLRKSRARKSDTLCCSQVMRRARQVLVKETAAAVKQFDRAMVQKTRLTRGPLEDQAAKPLKQSKTLPNTVNRHGCLAQTY